MYGKAIYLVYIPFILVPITTVTAGVFVDNFQTSHDYLVDGVGATGWDGFIGLGPDETVDLLSASIDRPGELYIQSTMGYWEKGSLPYGPFLYKIVEGDFIATVEVTDFPGLPGSIQGRTLHADSFIMARVPNINDAGSGEDYVCIGYFPTWSGNNRRSIDNSVEFEGGATGDGFDCDKHIQLERIGNDFHMRRSPDGITWTDMDGSPITRGDMDGLALQVGLGQCTYNNTTGYVAFDDFILEGPLVVSLTSTRSATNPNPSNREIGVLRDVILSWTQGKYAATHDVYIGTNLSNVDEADTTNPLDVFIIEGYDFNSYNIGRLEFDQTYYWRVDEVNGSPDRTIFKGTTWEFTTELFSCAIAGNGITATASSQLEEINGPEKTIDSSGLTSVTHSIDTRDDVHSTDISDMWVSSINNTPEWIQYDFDKPYKLASMLVWNFNGASIWSMLGLKDVTVEYWEEGGTAWQSLSDVPEFAMATGKNDYRANTIIPFDNLVVNSVKLTALSNWSGGVSSRVGLSEISFLAIPTYASSPDPPNGATNIPVNAILSWKAGREASRHKVYLSTDEVAVVSGTATVTTVSQTRYILSDVDMGTTYYWRVDEVNDVETTPIYCGDIWSFVTQD